MLSQKDRCIVEMFRRHIEGVASILDLRVFGFEARNSPMAESNIKVFIELEELTPEVRERICTIAWRIGNELERNISPLIVSHEQLENGALATSPLVVNARSNGIPVC